MSNSSNDDLLNYAQVNSLLLDTYEENCLDVDYSDMINDLKQTSWNSSASEGGNPFYWHSIQNMYHDSIPTKYVAF